MLVRVAVPATKKLHTGMVALTIAMSSGRVFRCSSLAAAFQPSSRVVLVLGPQRYLSRAGVIATKNKNTRFYASGNGGDDHCSQTDLDNHADQMNPNNDEYAEKDEEVEYSQDELDNYANQMNPNNDEYAGNDDYYEDERGDHYEYSQDELDNHADQMNPNNDEYWHSRE
jgi:hypothetical protein